MKSHVTMRRALEDPKLLGTCLPGESFLPWRALLIAAMGEPLTEEERALYQKRTGRAREPGQTVKELWVFGGRRAGKTCAGATLAVYLAGLRDYRSKLRIGERGRVLFIAQTMEQARIGFDYAAEMFESIPSLRRRVVKRTADTLTLSNGINLEVHAANFRGLRGMTAIAVFLDESCFLPSEGSVNATGKILKAARPMLLTTGGPLICMSSPDGQHGEMYRTYERHFGAKGHPRILVAQGASRDFNPSLPQEEIDAAYEHDPVSARAEYGGEFLPDVAALVARADVERTVSRGIRERAPITGVRYFGFVDGASGSGADSMTCGIAHEENGIRILDAVREWQPPFNPEVVVADLATLFKRYWIQTVEGDCFGEDWLPQLFRRHDIEYRVSKRTASELYANFVPELNCEKIALLDHARMIAQLLDLRVSSGSGKIVHPPGGHDDLINAAVGGLLLAKRRPGPPDLGPIELQCLRIHDPRDAPHLGTWDCDPPPRRNW
jgi:hypothetical protein